MIVVGHGFTSPYARVQFVAGQGADVRFGSLADIATAIFEESCAYYPKDRL
jgi:hypothetical protein